MRRVATLVCLALLVGAVAAAQNARVMANAPIYVTPNPAEGQAPPAGRRSGNRPPGHGRGP
jgi:hypothetical protein